MHAGDCAETQRLDDKPKSDQHCRLSVLAQRKQRPWCTRAQL